MDIQKLFDDKAEIYAKARPHYPKALYQWLADACDGHERVWDAACGNGQAAANLREYFSVVEASDVSAAQIENAPTYHGVHYSVQPCEQTGYPDDYFDAVCVALALHWFDYEKFWPEVKRVLRPGGLFAAWGYSWPHLGMELDGVLEQSLLQVIEPYWAPQNLLLWNEYKEVPFPFEPIRTPRFELIMPWTLDEFFSYLHSWSATRRCMEDRGDSFFAESYARMKEAWGGGETRPVTMDVFILAGRHGG
ncbi:class I SAM-dependent methyltransferase [Hahella aquimaris]|uniref:class I SAM-dependent methyltransferase n=1 Tax=Hahella sp. HNIBRBA332 TaxID=3015983 RepID=UPI00273BEB7C|nr:class I SAM-dependent methyltransferase [Hahella sp. HNIBRBA332]WLQ16765.1 class I SAM-dependent methyltransferase [Hahella sp. HNIBRBA332]